MALQWDHIIMIIVGFRECVESDTRCRFAKSLAEILEKLSNIRFEGDVCPLCGRVFKGSKGLFIHLKQSRCGMLLRYALYTAYTLYRTADLYVKTCRGSHRCCTICGKAFLRRADAIKHVVIEHLLSGR